MKKLFLMPLVAMSLGLFFLSPLAFAEGTDTHKNQTGKGHTDHGQGKGLGHHKDSEQVNITGRSKGRGSITESGSNRTNARGKASVSVKSEPNAITVKGLANGKANAGGKSATGSASGTLRISWGHTRASDVAHDLDRATNGASRSITNNRSIFNRLNSPVSPPGAPELPANMLFGTGLLIFGFGLIWYRRLW